MQVVIKYALNAHVPGGGERAPPSPLREGSKEVQLVKKISARWLCMPMPQEGGEGSTISPEGRVNTSASNVYEKVR